MALRHQIFKEGAVIYPHSGPNFLRIGGILHPQQRISEARVVGGGEFQRFKRGFELMDQRRMGGQGTGWQLSP